MAEPKAKKPFHEVVAENLIAQLKEGTAPWQKPWNPGAPGAALPMNPTTGKRYRGINAIHLMAQGYDDQRWMTYKQATAADAQVRKGEKGTLIQYWKFTEERLKKNDDGTIVIGKDEQPVKEIVQLERPKVFNAVVFNAEQIDGLPPLTVSKEKSWNSIERAEDILKASGATIRHDQVDRAFYRMSTDSIHLPQKEAFPKADRYYATALHELGHWTGHTSRLDRDLAHPFGSEGYAKEELRAEIASMIMGDELGIGHDPSQHVAYVKSWVKALQDDPLEIFRAAADAEKIQGYVLGLEQQKIQEQPVVILMQIKRENEHAEILAELNTPHTEFGYKMLESANVLEQTAKDAGYNVYFSRSENEFGGFDIRVNYEDTRGKTLPIFSELLEDAKVLTYIGSESVLGTNYTSDPGWQKAALNTAFASMDNNLTLAAKNVRDQVENIIGNPRELPEGVKFPKNWFPYSSFLELERAAVAEMTTQAETVITPEQQRRNRAEKFILSNLGGGLAAYVSKMNRSQLTLSREVLFDAQHSEPSSDFWQRNGEFLASFSQNWPDTKEKIDAAYKELDFATSLLPAKKYLVADNPSANEKLNIVLETNSAIKALAAVNGGENRVVHDNRILGNNQIDLNDQQGNFYQTLDAEKAAMAQGIMNIDEEMNVLPPQDAREWYQNCVESILEGSEAPNSDMEALGPEPGEQEAVFLSDMGQRVIPDISLNIAQENTPIKVPYPERNEAKTLGAKWDRSEQTWFVPAGISLDKFAKWNGGEAAAVAQDSTPPKATPDRSAERQELAVPYKDRAEAKAAGAKWDKEKKTWYAEAEADMEKLAKWKLENVKVEELPAMTLQEEVETALKNVGCILDADTDRGQKHPIMDGKGHRITVEGDKNGEKSGFYIIHTDGHPAGFMQNNRTKEELCWSSKGYVQTDEEKALLRMQAVQKQAEKAAQKQKDHESSAKRVNKQLGQLSEPQQQTTYLKKKGLQVHKGVFTDKGGDKTYIPAYDVSGKQWTMQYINEDGTKRFAKNARKEGCFHVVGGLEALKDAPVLIIAEGYATASSITEATQYPTVAAFDSGNLEPVAKALKEVFPDKPIIIAGDDDVAQSCKMKTKANATVNVGREKALETAKAVGGVAVFPIFAKGEVPSKDELSLIKPAAYTAHQTAMRKLEVHASGEKSLGEAEVKILEAARLTEAQQEILKRADRHTDFNDLAVNSSLGRDGVAMQMKAVITSQLNQHQSQGQKKVEKLVQAQEKKRTARHSI